MPNISVNISGRNFSVACGEGDENRVRDLAAYVDKKAKMVVNSGSGISENQVLMLTCLVLADELQSNQKSNMEETSIMELIDEIDKKVNFLRKTSAK